MLNYIVQPVQLQATKLWQLAAKTELQFQITCQKQMMVIPITYKIKDGHIMMMMLKCDYHARADLSGISELLIP